MAYVLGNLSDRTPQWAYSLRPGFDFARYLEEKSHFDEASYTIDAGVGRLVGGIGDVKNAIELSGREMSANLQSMTHDITRGLSDISSRLETGFADVSGKLSDIDDRIVTLTEVCEAGFKNVVIEIAKSNSLLSDILETLKTPDQTWANEQYQSAVHCMSIGLRSDAINFCDKAISGDAHHAGFPIEPSFYFLRGSARLGDITEEGRSTLDLERSEADFLVAIKYCADINNVLKSRSFNSLAWARYYDGRPDQAIVAAKDAIAVNVGSALSHYLIAKIAMSEERFLEAKGHFKAAVELDESLAGRCLVDPDFMAHRAMVENWLRDTQKEKYEELTTKLDREGGYPAHLDFHQFTENEGLRSQFGNTIAFRVKNLDKVPSILDLFRLISGFSNLKTEMAVSSRSSYEKLVSRSDKFAKKKPVPSPDTSSPIIIAVIVSILAFFYIWTSVSAAWAPRLSSSQINQDGWAILSFLASAALGAVVLTAAISISVWVRDIIKTRHSDKVRSMEYCVELETREYLSKVEKRYGAIPS